MTLGQMLKEGVEEIMKLWRKGFQKETAGTKNLSVDFACCVQGTTGEGSGWNRKKKGRVI